MLCQADKFEFPVYRVGHDLACKTVGWVLSSTRLTFPSMADRVRCWRQHNNAGDLLLKLALIGPYAWRNGSLCDLLRRSRNLLV